MTTSGASLEQRVYHAIHHHVRTYGAAPSYRDIGLAVGIAPRHVGRPLQGLARRGLLSVTPGQARSIVLVDRLANVADVEIERAVKARGGSVVWGVTTTSGGHPVVASCGIGTRPDPDHVVGLLLGVIDVAQD